MSQTATSSDHDHEDYEPTPGLPEALPEGEHILWQGGPTTMSIARRVFYFRFVTAWFVLIALWTIWAGIYDGQQVGIVLRNTTILIMPLVAALSVLWVLARVISGTTLYTITNKRLVIRAGVAILKSINIPFQSIAAAGVKINRDETADIPVGLVPGQRIAYLALWPHVRGLMSRDIQPVMRGVPDGRKAAAILSRALSEFHDQPMPNLSSMPEKSAAAIKAAKAKGALKDGAAAAGAIAKDKGLGGDNEGVPQAG